MWSKDPKNHRDIIFRQEQFLPLQEALPEKVRRIMEKNLLNVGFGNFVVASRVVAIISPTSAPMKRLKDEARQEGRLVDATQGRRTRSVLVMDSNHVVLSAVQPDTMSQRYVSVKETKESR